MIPNRKNSSNSGLYFSAGVRVLLLVVFIQLFLSCFWGTVEVELSQRTRGTVSFDFTVPYMLKDFHTSRGRLLPFSGNGSGFRSQLALLPSVTVNSLTFENTASGWNVRGQVSFSSIAGLTGIASFFSGRLISTEQWDSESTITLVLPGAEFAPGDDSVVSHYKTLLSSRRVELRFSGNQNIARIENGERISDNSVLFVFSPADMLEREQRISIGW